MDSINDISRAVERLREAGRIDELRAAMRAADVDSNGYITFNEMRSHEYLRGYCRNIEGRSRQGYYCADGEQAGSGQGYGFRLDLNDAANDAANEYLRGRQRYGRLAAAGGVVEARGQIQELNAILAAANLPRISLEFANQVASHVDANFDHYNRLGYVPAASPPSGMRILSF
ncbi:MAG: hypothetical protein J0M34_08225 [Alphaproteobacteria bacterium]|nr:hypothetical protein [Alphaproteobacteria bacterium]